MNKIFYFVFSMMLFIASSASANYRVDTIQQLDNGITYITSGGRSGVDPYRIFVIPAEDNPTFNFADEFKLIDAQSLMYTFSILATLETENGERFSAFMESSRGIFSESGFDCYNVKGQEVPARSALYQAVDNLTPGGLLARNLGDGRLYHVHNIGDLGFPFSVSKDDIVKLEGGSENLTTGKTSQYWLTATIISYQNLCLYHSLESIAYEAQYLRLSPAIKYVLPGEKIDEETMTPYSYSN